MEENKNNILPLHWWAERSWLVMFGRNFLFYCGLTIAPQDTVCVYVFVVFVRVCGVVCVSVRERFFFLLWSDYSRTGHFLCVCVCGLCESVCGCVCVCERERESI